LLSEQRWMPDDAGVADRLRETTPARRCEALNEGVAMLFGLPFTALDHDHRHTMALFLNRAVCSDGVQRTPSRFRNMKPSVLSGLVWGRAGGEPRKRSLAVPGFDEREGDERPIGTSQRRNRMLQCGERQVEKLLPRALQALAS
jgi:hypothetical protein